MRPTVKRALWVFLGIIAVFGGSAALAYWETRHAASERAELVLSFLHFALPIAVIAMEIYVLRQAFLERRERRDVMEGLDAFRVAIGRAHYMQEIERAILNADREIVFTSATMATSRVPDQKRVLDAVREREQSDRRGPYAHRGIVYDEARTLPGVLELLCNTSVQVRMSSYAGLSRLRFLVRDQTFSVIGVAASPSTIDEIKQTDRSFSIDSHFLGQALCARFEEEWKRARDPWEVFSQLIKQQADSNPGVTQLEIMNLLGEVQVEPECLGKCCEAFGKLPAKNIREAVDRTDPVQDEKGQAKGSTSGGEAHG
jgi:hypothetical protein